MLSFPLKDVLVLYIRAARQQLRPKDDKQWRDNWAKIQRENNEVLTLKSLALCCCLLNKECLLKIRVRNSLNFE